MSMTIYGIYLASKACVKNFTFGVAPSAKVVPKNKMVSSVLGLSYAMPNPFLEGLVQGGHMSSPFISMTVDKPNQRMWNRIYIRILLTYTILQVTKLGTSSLAPSIEGDSRAD
jgi:hypothetical protein